MSTLEVISILGIPVLLAGFLSINMGASGTSTAFAAAYGAYVIKKKWIPILFGIMVIIGAFLGGKEVSLTLGEGILPPELFTPIYTSVILFVIAISLFGANLMGVPQSTSQTTVLAIAGGAAALGKLNTDKLLYEIIPMWFILPFVGFTLTYIISKWIFPHIKTKSLEGDFEHIREYKGLKTALIISSLYVAFSVGANNVANAAGPIASLFFNEFGVVEINGWSVSMICLLIAAPLFGFGSYLLGFKITRSAGKEIVKITPFYATIIGIIVASLLFYASITQGIPSSLVQLNGACFIALSMTKSGRKLTLSNKTVRRFLSVWMVAPAFAFLVTYLLTLLVVDLA
ncbi:inorganic phosphate transporter [Vicingaceae bacterium]|nr:inorganic phosphate transporter [Vicingaceae bacterium]